MSEDRTRDIDTETELQLIDGALADLGNLDRRARCQTLSEDDYTTLSRRLRDRLKALRAARLDSDEPAILLTDAGMAAAVACAVGQRPEIRELIRRAPALMMASRLADHPEITRVRTYGSFAAIDGGRS